MKERTAETPPIRKSADYMPGQRLRRTRQAEKHTSKFLGRFTLLGVGHFDIKMREGIGKEEGRVEMMERRRG
jgi:hypothetical protein